MPENGLAIYTVYERPRDYPKAFVVRRSVIRGGVEYKDAELWEINYSLEAVRESIPPGLHRLPRHPNDDPVIVEVWL